MKFYSDVRSLVIKDGDLKPKKYPSLEKLMKNAIE